MGGGRVAWTVCICPLGFGSERASLRTLCERVRCVERARHARINPKGGEKKERGLNAHQKGI